MKNTRGFVRFDVQMKAQYFFKERKRGWEECTIIKLSRKGMGIRFHTREKISIGSAIHLRVFVSKGSEHFIVKGVLKWIEEKGEYFVGGVKLTEILDEGKWVNLIHFIDNPSEERTKKIMTMTPPIQKVRKSCHPSPPQRIF